MSHRAFTGLVASVLVFAAGLAAANADPVADFYKGKTVRVIVSANPGGGYDTYARLVGDNMARFIPGHPTMIYQNMQGAGHKIAADYLYNKAARDGSVLGVIGQTLARQQAIGEKGVRFDVRKFNWIGNPTEANNLLVTWHTSKVKTIQDAFKTEAVIGGAGTGSITSELPRVINNVLGTKFRIITGFRGGSSINLAMIRGEVEGRGSLNWASLKATKYEWYRDKKVNIIVQVGIRKAKDLPNVPLLLDLARNQAEREVFKVISADVPIGRPMMAPEDVPADRVAALRKAFNETMKDSKFLARAKKMRLDINPVPGEELQKIVDETASVSPDIAKLVTAALTKGATFKCKDLAKDKKLCRSKKKKRKK